jgi:hypothetical protein
MKWLVYSRDYACFLFEMVDDFCSSFGLLIRYYESIGRVVVSELRDQVERWKNYKRMARGLLNENRLREGLTSTNKATNNTVIIIVYCLKHIALARS